MFRTFNASIVLDDLLHKDTIAETVEEKKAEYDRANKEVGEAWICAGLSTSCLAILAVPSSI